MIVILTKLIVYVFAIAIAKIYLKDSKTKQLFPKATIQTANMTYSTSNPFSLVRAIC